MYIITDWANNKLDYSGKFQRPCFAVPMEFDSFEDAWDYLYIKYPDEENLNNYYVEEIKK
jgi:hypothetical protein